MEIDTQVELYDSDRIKIQNGPYAWAVTKQYTRMDLEDFRKTLTEKFQEIGFEVFVSCNDTNVEGMFWFTVEIRRRLVPIAFDYDRMRHEVVNNILEEPDQEKGRTIKADQDLARVVRQERFHGKHQH